MIYTESVIYQLTASPAIVPRWKIYAKALTFVDTICDKKKNGKKNNSLRLHCFADCRPSELITQSSTPLYCVLISLYVHFNPPNDANRLDQDAHKCLI